MGSLLLTVALVAMRSPPLWVAPLLLVTQTASAVLIVKGRRVLARRLTSIRTMVELDPGTGCLNRHGFSRMMDQALALAAAKPPPREIALLALDLDYFKQINDRFGHLVGDAVLVEVAAVLRSAVGEAGCVARLGGEEFAALLPDSDAERAGEIAEAMLAQLRSHRISALAPGIVVTMSVGIAVEQATTLDAGAALRARADEALYRAKRHGRNRALLWAPGVRSLSTPTASASAIAQRARWTEYLTA